MLRTNGKKAIQTFIQKSTSFSTKATSNNTPSEIIDIGSFGKMIQPKLHLTGVHARYANALYSVAAQQNALENVEKELISIEQSIQKSVIFANFLKDPTISRTTKKNDIAKLLKEAKASKPVAGLFDVLAENGRLAETTGVIATFKKLMSAYRGEVAAKVFSADELSKSELEQVKKALSSRIKKGETLVIETAVEPDMLGGLKVQMGNYFIDLSLATKIQKIHQVLANTAV